MSCFHLWMSCKILWIKCKYEVLCVINQCYNIIVTKLNCLLFLHMLLKFIVQNCISLRDVYFFEMSRNWIHAFILFTEVDDHFQKNNFNANSYISTAVSLARKLDHRSEGAMCLLAQATLCKLAAFREVSFFLFGTSFCVSYFKGWFLNFNL